MALAVSSASAQADPAAFPAEASRFVETEWPAMSAAVAARDRSYFEGAMARTVDLAERWGFKTRANAALAPYEACTQAVSDLVVVGLCQLTPQASECTPHLASGFERHRAQCRALAGR
ncbi:hypothetical protein [Xenophilus sp. Marseille-Q4582]|uniref:hypothetical protein n=1 Tax=Xenophilus sp. Marseille-Q4582 TaxID=2866600 RepID=UPI001CE40B49|nr:hypothetical protein [Xenophilus sp. Marseille-Q4582]